MKKYLLYIMPFFLLLSCTKLVEVGTPKDRLVTSKVFESDATATAAMAGVYVSMLNDINFTLPYSMAYYCGLYADELTYKSSDISRLSVYKDALVSKDAPTNVIWTKGYYFIYQANNILAGVQGSTGVTAPVKKQLSGECYFLRAFWFFYLVNLYGDIPIPVTPDYTVNGTMSRTPVPQVYQQIIADLKKADSLLPEKYVAGDAVTESPDRVRPNKYTAIALLARAYLYTQNWAAAEQQAGRVIANTGKYSLEAIPDVFKTGSREAIWQFQTPTNSSGTIALENTTEGKNFVIVAAPGPSGSTLSPSLLNLFSADDKRGENWIGRIMSTSPPIEEYTFPYKYKLNAIIPDALERSAVFRLAELYLIRAEARAQQQGKLPDAITDVDAIRHRAGIGLIADINPGISKDALLDSIYTEGQREFFCEWGHRWMDLKRTGRANEVMTAVAVEKETTWSPDKLLWPVPLADMQNNPHLMPQNNGYE